MSTHPKVDVAELREIGDLAVSRAKKWIEASTKYPTDHAAKLLSRVLKDEGGLDFTVAFVDEVVRPEDIKIAARNLSRLVSKSPKFLPAYLRLPAKLGGVLAPMMPEIVVPAARFTFRMLVGDLVMDVSERKLGKAIAKLRETGARLNMNLLGEAVLGEKEAQRRLNDTAELLRRPDVDYVSLKVSAVTGPHNKWAFDQIVDHAVSQLLPLYREAASYPTKKFINLDMEEYHDLHLTVTVFKKILEHPELQDLEAGIVLQAYLPDALDAMIDLQEWAAARRAKGGAGIKVRVVKGANLMMETVDATVHGWELTTQPSKAHTDANYMRVLDYALTPERTKNVRIGIAGMNIFTVAYGYELAMKRGVIESGGCEFEMLTGMAATLSKAVTEDTGPMLYYVPVVHPEEYDVAIAYLVRRLEENAAPDNFMSAVFDIATSDEVLEREKGRFLTALGMIESISFDPRRSQNRLTEGTAEIEAEVQDELGNWRFANTADSDPALPANLQWAEEIVAHVPNSKLGVKTIADAAVNTVEEVKEVFATAEKAAEKWAATSAAERAEILHKAGVIMSQRRADLIEVAASECGKALDQGDVEVSEGIDYAHYYAEAALALEKVPGAKFRPAKVIVVTPPWNFPFAIPAGSTMSALAAGSATILKPAPQAKRTGALLAEILWEAGVPKDVLQLVDVPENEVGKELLSNEAVDRVILTGSIDTAKLFRSWRSNLEILAETSGKNSIIVTPSADLDLAVKDVVYSAFGHAGQKCSAASLVILVGTVGTSKRFHGQLIDAVKSLKVGYPTDLGIQVGPLVEKAEGKLLRGLTVLEPGQKWAIAPEQLDDSGKLWSPGVRSGVKPGSEYHLTEYFGPILGVMRCDSLKEAIEIQNQVEYGLTAGIHTLNPEEIQYWLDNVQAGNVYINRGITGAIVRRQPFGGWKRSVVGNGTKAGGPSYLFSLGEWKRDAASAIQAHEKSPAKPASALSTEVLKLAKALQLPQAEIDMLELALVSDEKEMDREFSKLHDPSQLGVERNILRYLPTAVTVRAGSGTPVWELLRVLAAGLAAGSPLSLSVADKLPVEVRSLCIANQVSICEQSEDEWLEDLPNWAEGAGYDGRIRLLGEDKDRIYEKLAGNVDVAIWSNEVTLSGRVEILPFLHEQAISLTNHRFGDPTPITRDILQDNVVDY